MIRDKCNHLMTILKPERIIGVNIDGCKNIDSVRMGT